jgi:hypothetical protein
VIETNGTIYWHRTCFIKGMTSEMNVLLDRLQEAIDEAISDSDRISGIVAEMKKSGYDLCLIVESSAAISPIDEKQSPDSASEPRSASAAETELNSDDLAFLREMNIAG